MYKTCVLNKEQVQLFSQLANLKCDKVILSKENDRYYATIFGKNLTLEISDNIALKFMK